MEIFKRVLTFLGLVVKLEKGCIMSELNRLSEISVERLERLMLRHIENVVNYGRVSAPESVNFCQMFKEWIFRKNNINSKCIVVNFKLDNALETCGEVERLTKKIFAVKIDGVYYSISSPEIFSFGVVTTGHEIQHIVQSLFEPSWEESVYSTRNEIADWEKKYSNRKNKKKLHKLVNRLAEDVEADHFSERDADEKAFQYSNQLFDRLIEICQDVETLEFLVRARQCVDINKSEMKKYRAKLRKGIKDDVKQASRLGVLNPTFTFYKLT